MASELKIGRFRVNLPIDPPSPFKTARALSDLYAFQYGQWAPIQNSQIIGRYKEITAGELKFSDLPG